MNRSRTAAVLTAALTFALGAVALASSPQPAAAHGAAMTPGSRTYLCWQDGLSQTGEVRPNNPACSAAVAQSGANSLYNWFSVLRSDAGGRTTGFIPDGQLCSGGNPGYKGYDLPRTDWPLTHLTSGSRLDFRYSNWAHHPGTFYFYVTKDSWSPTRALAWSDLEEPFLTVTNPPQRGSVGTNDGHYYFSGNLPSGKSGRHIIYSRWVRSDSQENFFGCSDVTFDGGNGQVTGVGPGGSNPPTTAPPTTAPPTTAPPTTAPPTTAPPTTAPPTTAPPTTPPPGGSDCMAVYKVASTWQGGFQGEVTIMNHGSTPFAGWTAKWTWPNGQVINQIWSATQTTSGASVTATNVGYNGTIAPEGTTTFGFLASSTGTNGLPTVTCARR
ncbi:lytic polysaccharide monooxygenase [Micromonospora lupini]|uniref:Extracellular endoglucanase n=1 Tax=Micromonospora lupini str. Lupac 08 TaxID=1150864 RepID=I0L866_9ACTN|nr:lytic polysaccharide monooxygenase [Micromonospora lupini]CCH20013.1 Extracellular endoglucanase [Micromonospora lupini str. Lupac 08]